jgi:predicted nucleic-acid-binding protein
MKVIVDTNILVRAAVQDDRKQAQAATALLKEAELIAISLPCLCEFVWVLRRVYGFDHDEICASLEALLDTGNVSVNRPAVEAGLVILKAGGDFADGLIAYEGGWLGGDTFVSFDKKAVTLVARQGRQTRLLAD